MSIAVAEACRLLLEDNPNREFTAFGKTRLMDDGAIEIIDIRFPSQESGTTTTELTAEDQEQFLIDLVNDGEDPSTWNCWIHSHHSMAPDWSGTDEQNFDDFGTLGAEWYCHIVLSTQGYRGAITAYKPIRIYDLDVPVSVEEPQDEIIEELERYRAELLGIDTKKMLKLKQEAQTVNRVKTYGRQIKKPKNTRHKNREEYADNYGWGGNDWISYGDGSSQDGFLFDGI